MSARGRVSRSRTNATGPARKSVSKGSGESFDPAWRCCTVSTSRVLESRPALGFFSAAELRYCFLTTPRCAVHTLSRKHAHAT